MLTDAQWMRLEPLIEACRPKGKTPPQDLRRTISAIVWRHANGAKWRAIPAELGPWSRAAQTFIRWAHLGVWEKLLLLALLQRCRADDVAAVSARELTALCGCHRGPRPVPAAAESRR